jgi:hypothetical protein
MCYSQDMVIISFTPPPTDKQLFVNILFTNSCVTNDHRHVLFDLIRILSFPYDLSPDV